VGELLGGGRKDATRAGNKHGFLLPLYGMRLGDDLLD